jgi:starch phosphorylase
MKIDPRAGLPAAASDLVDVPKLIAAYYQERPDPAIPDQRVVFGTSGHRGSSFTKTFNEWHILAITQAICLHRKRNNIDGPLFLGIDTHGLSRPAVDTALEVLAANGVDVMLAGREEYTPTPVVSHAILTYNRGRTAGLADGIVITPSHNPPDTGGFKYNPPHGGPAEEEITAWIEVCGAAIRHGSNLQDLRGKLQRRTTSETHRGRSARRRQRGICIRRPRTRGPATPGDNVSDPQSSKSVSKISAPQDASPLGIDALRELALNLYWSWNHGSDKLWEALDNYLWETTQNPWVILQTVSHDKVKTLLATPDFQELLSTLISHKRKFFKADAWFQKTHPGAPLTAIAYFSMEFMLTEALPIYSGGLGNVAGDQMKAASDLGVPVVGVGLLWGQGYFRQDFDSAGNQRAFYPVNDPGQLPIQPVRRANGEWLRIEIHLTGARIWLRCWQVLVGRTTLYLLDANDFANTAAQRGITSELYGGDAEMRLKQEIVLGIGGWRLLREIGLNPEVCHLNEGHAAFAVLERARYYMADHHVSFELALTITRAGNMFTTHTAVPAGFDRFAPDLCWKHLEHYAKDELAIPMESLLALGRQNPGDAAEPLNMAYLALRGSGQVNGVSKLHGEVSRQIFQPLFNRWPRLEIPIGSVTNGIHVPTWDSVGADSLWTKACGADRWRGDRPLADDVRRLTDTALWQMRTAARKAMLAEVRERYTRQLSAEGKSQQSVPDIFRDGTLTVGFARRFATYKRPDLLLHDPDRLIRLLTNSQHPVQLILAGKAHPEDMPGQALIRQWNDFVQRPEVRGHVVFLSDYDMQMAQELVQGMDLWINTPRRPWEACGTSGMKVLCNGGLNISELDGWWAEAYTPKVGWAIGDGKEHGEDAAWDAYEVEALYALLEQQVVPDFYDLDEQGLPAKWLERVRESMATLTPAFSASRAIREYTNDRYLPAATGYQARSANDGRLGSDVKHWQQSVAGGWATLRLGKVTVDTQKGQHRFQISVEHGSLHPDQFTVEIYAEPAAGIGAKAETLSASSSSSESPGTVVYSVCCSATRPSGDYTARIVPSHKNASVPLEADQILWQR